MGLKAVAPLSRGRSSCRCARLHRARLGPRDRVGIVAERPIRFRPDQAPAGRLIDDLLEPEPLGYVFDHSDEVGHSPVIGLPALERL
jgi:hypothetical protein